jgi:hypothetical protein
VLHQFLPLNIIRDLIFVRKLLRFKSFRLEDGVLSLMRHNIHAFSPSPAAEENEGKMS